MASDIPDREQFLDTARIWAEAEFEIRYARPQRARDTARAWVGLIQANIMGGMENYASGSVHQRYERPVTAVIPAAPKIAVSGLGYSAVWMDQGEPFHLIDEHQGVVAKQIGDVSFSEDSDTRGCSVVRMPEPRVLVTWHQLGLIFPDPKYATPATFRLIRVDGTEHGACPLASTIFAAFATRREAERWTEQRLAGLIAEHDRNHNRKRIELEQRRARTT